MPIVGEGESVHIEYEIPKEIKEKIPDYFYYAMAGELVSVFGPYILQHPPAGYYDEENDEWVEDGEEDYYDLDTSTGGWCEAFYATCKKLDMQWLYDYWRTLAWYDSDIFDGEIEDEIIKRFCEKDHLADHANCYYKYLIEKRKSEMGKVIL